MACTGANGKCYLVWRYRPSRARRPPARNLINLKIDIRAEHSPANAIRVEEAELSMDPYYFKLLLSMSVKSLVEYDPISREEGTQIND